MEEASLSRQEAPRSLRNRALSGLLLFGSLLLCVLVLEIAVRLFVDLDAHRHTRIGDIDLERRIAFLPGRIRTYETSEFRFTLSTNAYGRRDVEWTPSMLADPENVLFVGDSLIVGFGVEHEATIPALLEARLAGAGAPREVFNFGIAGGGPAGYKLLLEQAIGLGFAARLVLVSIFVGNDFYPEVLTPLPDRPRRAEQPERRGGRSQLATFLRLRASQSPRLVGWMLTLCRWLGITVYDTAGSYVFLRTQRPEQQDLIRQILSIVGDIKKLCAADGRELRLVIIPNKIQVENAPALTNAIYDAKQPNQLVLDYCDEIELPCLDLLPRFLEEQRRSDEPLYFPVDRHLTERGTEIAADEIFGFLGETGPQSRNL